MGEEEIEVEYLPVLDGTGEDPTVLDVCVFDGAEDLTYGEEEFYSAAKQGPMICTKLDDTTVLIEFTEDQVDPLDGDPDYEDEDKDFYLSGTIGMLQNPFSLEELAIQYFAYYAVDEAAGQCAYLVDASTMPSAVSGDIELSFAPGGWSTEEGNLPTVSSGNRAKEGEDDY